MKIHSSLLSRITRILAGLCLSLSLYANEAPRIEATLTPFYGLVTGMTDASFQVHRLIPGNQSSHTFHLKPSHLAALKEADVIIWGGEILEPYLTKIVASLEKTKKIIDLSKTPNLILFDNRQFDDSHADDAPHSHDEESHAHGSECPHDHTDLQFDPHYWLNPQNALFMVHFIATELQERFPVLKENLSAKTSSFVSLLERLDQDINTQFLDLKEKPFLVFHDAYQYFEQQYGLKSQGTITLHPEWPSHAKHLAKIEKQIEEDHIHCIFTEPQFSDKLIKKLAKNHHFKMGQLDPEGFSIEAKREPNAYILLLQNLSTSFQTCLKEE